MVIECNGMVHPIPRGKGAIICMRPEMSAVDSDNYIVPVWMIERFFVESNSEACYYTTNQEWKSGLVVFCRKQTGKSFIVADTLKCKIRMWIGECTSNTVLVYLMKGKRCLTLRKIL